MARIIIMVLGILLTFGGLAAAGVTDTIQAPTPYFVPTDAQKYDAPYYRWYGEDWGWTHNSIGGTITSAALNISAFDVDYDQGERDIIWAYDSGAWVNLGYLAGANDSWAFTNFPLGASFFDDIATGLQVKIEIDSTAAGWAVTLAKSSLSIDGGTLPPPQPTPEPTTMLLLGSGILGLIGFGRKKIK
jgi:hypothetical protein